MASGFLHIFPYDDEIHFVKMSLDPRAAMIVAREARGRRLHPNKKIKERTWAEIELVHSPRRNILRQPPLVEKHGVVSDFCLDSAT